MQNIIQTEDINLIVNTIDSPSITMTQVQGSINTVQSEDVLLTFTDVAQQGLPGAQGNTGEKGDKGDALVYNLLTPEEKSEVIAQFDNAIGNTSYANIFLNAYLS